MTYPFSFMTKKGSSFGFESSLILRARFSIGHFFYRGSVYSFEGCSEDLMYFLFFFIYISLLNTGLVTILLHSLYFIFIYDDDVCFSTSNSTCVVSFLSLYTFLYVHNPYFCFTHDALMSFA